MRRLIHFIALLFILGSIPACDSIPFLDQFSKEDRAKEQAALTSNLSLAFLLSAISNNATGCYDTVFTYIRYNPITSTSNFKVVPVTNNTDLASTYDGAVFVYGVPAGGKVQIYNPAYTGNTDGLVENGCSPPASYTDTVCPIDIVNTMALTYPEALPSPLHPTYYNIVFVDAGDYVMRFRCYPASGTTPTVWPQVKNLF